MHARQLRPLSKGLNDGLHVTRPADNFGETCFFNNFVVSWIVFFYAPDDDFGQSCALASAIPALSTPPVVCLL